MWKNPAFSATNLPQWWRSCLLSLFYLSLICEISPIQSLSHLWVFAILQTAACQASLSITNSWSLLKLMSVESVMPSNHLILCHPLPSHLQSFPASGSFQMCQFFASGGRSIGVSASTSVLPMNIQDWFPLELTGWISLLSKELSRVFSNTTVQKHQFYIPFTSFISFSESFMYYFENLLHHL